MRYLVFDRHNDTLLDPIDPRRGGGRSFFERSAVGHIDLPRAVEGGLAGGFFAMSPPEHPPKKPGPDATPAELDAYLTALQTPVPMDHARTMTLGMMALLLRIEAQSAGRLRVIRDIAALRQCLADGVLAAIMHIEGAEAIDPGLDALYVFYEAGLRSIGPVWSRPNAFGAGVPCNLTDRQLDAIRASGGIVGVNFHVGFLREDGRQDADTPLQRIVDHTRYLVDHMGIDHVALGSDFDGATMPAELEDVAGLPRLMAALSVGGFGPGDLEKIGSANWVRVLEATWG